MLTKREKLYLVGLYFVSLGIRFITFFFFLAKNRNYWQVDSQTYHTIATSIAGGNGIALSDGLPAFYRLPGYPFFLSTFYRFFGADPWYPLIAQICIAAFIPVLVFLLARQIFATHMFIAYGASALSAIHLGLVLYSGFLMTESLFIFFFLLFALFFFPAVHMCWCSKGENINKPERERLWRSVVFLPEPFPDAMVYDFFDQSSSEEALKTVYRSHLLDGSSALRSIALAGFFLGIASLFRPVGHYVLALVILVLLFSQGSRLWKTQKILLFSFAWLGIVGWWLVRNLLLTGHLFFHTLPGGHFLYLSAARVVAQVDGSTYEQARGTVHDKVELLMKEKKEELGRPLQEIEKCLVHEKLARYYFISHPLITLKTWCTDIVRTCFSLYSAELYYLDNKRPEYDYFSSQRTWRSMFEKYLFPASDNKAIIALSFFEMFLFLFMLLGFLLALLNLLFSLFGSVANRAAQCEMVKIVPFMMLFVVIALAGGYARMRLPIEPFLFIFSLYGWQSVFIKKEKA